MRKILAVSTSRKTDLQFSVNLLSGSDLGVNAAYHPIERLRIFDARNTTQAETQAPIVVSPSSEITAPRTPTSQGPTAPIRPHIHMGIVNSRLGQSKHPLTFGKKRLARRRVVKRHPALHVTSVEINEFRRSSIYTNGTDVE